MLFSCWEGISENTLSSERHVSQENTGMNSKVVNALFSLLEFVDQLRDVGFSEMFGGDDHDRDRAVRARPGLAGAPDRR